MAICIYFENDFQREATHRPENCTEWIIKEEWSVNADVIQKIFVENVEESLASYFYVDLEIVSAFEECDAKIVKSGRMASNNIKFLMQGSEYSCFRTHSANRDANTENRGRHFTYKITLTPIFHLRNEIFKKSGKRTKIDLLEGLKTLSKNILSIKEDDEKFVDIIVCCGDQEVKAHKNILSARSMLFKKFLHGEEDEEVKSCFEIIIDTDDVSRNGNAKDELKNENNALINYNNSTNEDYTTTVHTQKDQEVHVLDTKPEVSDNDFIADCHDGTAAHTEKDDKIQYVQQNIQQIGDATDNCGNNDKDEESQNFSEKKSKISEYDASKNNDKDESGDYAKKDNEIKHRLEVKPNLRKGDIVDDNCIKDVNGCTNAEAATARCAAKDSEIQKSFEIEPESAFSNHANISAIPPDKEIKNYLDIEPEKAFNDANDVLVSPAVRKNKIQNFLEIEPGNVLNNDNDISVDPSNKNNKVQSFKKIEPENSLYSHDDTSAVLSNENNEVRNSVKTKPENGVNNENDNDTLVSLSNEKDESQNFAEMEAEDVLNNDILVVPSNENNEVQQFAKMKPENVLNNDNAAISSNENNKVQNFTKIEPENALYDDNDISAVFSNENNEVRNFVKTEPENGLNNENSSDTLVALSNEKDDVQNFAEIEHGNGLNNDILVVPSNENNEVQHFAKIEPGNVLSNDNVSMNSQENLVQNDAETAGTSHPDILKVRLKKVHSSIFREFMEFIYSGKCETLDIQKSRDLFRAARDYGISDLEFKCIVHLGSQISIETIDDIYNFASEYNCEELQIYVLDFAKKEITRRRNIEAEIIEDEMTEFEKRRWLEVMRNHPTYSRDIKSFKKGKKFRNIFLRYFPGIFVDEDGQVEENA